MVIVGIDPGSQRTGYGAIAVRGGRMRRLEGGVLRPPTGDGLSARCWALSEELRAILHRLRPDAVAMEECFVGRYARAALVLGHARGALMVAVLSEKLPLFEYAPREIKLAVTGAGGAHKKQIQAMVPRLVSGLPPRVSADEADALAVAVCHANRKRVPVRVAEAGEVRP
jgi:crossover junction endodeoxyribonuclease RuvC